MKRIPIQIGGIFLLVLVAACSGLSDLQDQANGARQTAQAVVTQVQGSGLQETLQAAATEIDESGALQTARAIATQQGSRLLGTARAVATERGPAVIETARAIATDQGSRLVETARAVVTQEGPVLADTAQALGTRAASSVGDLPEDIPLVEDDQDNLFASRSLVSYTTGASLQSVVDFYIAQMPLYGWTANTDSPPAAEESVVRTFTKGGRYAVITISVVPLSSRTLVVIAVT